MLTSASGSISNNVSYGNERSSNNLESEYAIDPASGGFFHTDSKKHDDLKEMLDSNKDSLKLEAMKRVIGMVAKGRDASVLFPAVVKNVVSKNIEVKKLVYVYLERYAEEQQDLALLSISTFQRALKEPNQLIRAGALRVLSSIRVGMIAPIVMLAIKDAAQDMSPYVRKTAAHAIPKLFSLDIETKPELILIIQKLLADRTVLVIGSAVMAFTKVCPDRVDLIHQVYRKLCALLVDVDEWGQVIILNMLTRYCRTQFSNPNQYEKDDSEKNFYDTSSDGSEKPITPTLDPDHRLLLRSARPLLQSRNAAVVVAVAQLYHHCAPKSEAFLAAKALVRLLRSHTEVQGIVLNAIASISYQKRCMFEPNLKSFFVRTSDPTRIKLAKLDILTNLATDANVSVILREMQTYISSSDKYFVAAAIQAIGRCACQISEVTDACLNGLVSLLSSKDEAVVAESVVVIKKLLQTRAAEPKDIIRQMARLIDNITVPHARAAILWLLGEHCKAVPKIAPDVLRKMAKSFADEQDIVKLQILNLAVKLYLTNPEQTSELSTYIFNLSRYDQNYDIRDRARLLKHFTQNTPGKLVACAADIFLVIKPAPLLQSQFKDHEQLQLGSLSHYINMRAVGYEHLPPFPQYPPPGTVRDVETSVAAEHLGSKSMKKESFSWISGSSAASADDSQASSDDCSSGTSESSDESDESNESLEKDGKSSDESQSTSTSTSEGSNSDVEVNLGFEDEEENQLSIKKQSTLSNKEMRQPPNDDVLKSKSNLDLLLDLDFMDSFVPVMTPSLSDFLSPISNRELSTQISLHIQVVAPPHLPTESEELLNKVSGGGLRITYKFNRTPHLFLSSMVNVGLTFHNTSQNVITDIRIGEKNLPYGLSLHDFACVGILKPGLSIPGHLGIDFNDSTHSANFEIISSIGSNNVSIKPAIGELLRPVSMPESTFLSEQSKLKGMNEHSVTTSSCISNDIVKRIYKAANIASCQCDTDGILRFAGQTLSSSSLVLVTVKTKDQQLMLTVNCEKFIIGSMLLNELKVAISQ